jgi:four helix bundle protein
MVGGESGTRRGAGGQNKPGRAEELDVFRQAHDLVLEVYRMTRTFPREEQFGLISQMRRAAFSVPVNLAEGGARLSRNEFRQFASIAGGSLAEVEYCARLAKDLGYLSEQDKSELSARVQRVSRMLTALIRSLTK